MARVSAYLLLCLAAAAPLRAQTATLKGKRVSIDEPPGSQTKTLETTTAIGDALHLGPITLPVEARGKRILVARKDGGRPTWAIRSGKSFSWTWKSEEGRHRVSLRFENRDGVWYRYSAEAIEYEIAGITLRLHDVNCDGRYGDHVSDGFSVAGSNAICPYRDVIPVGVSTIRILEVADDGSTLRVDTQTIEVLEEPGLDHREAQPTANATRTRTRTSVDRTVRRMHCSRQIPEAA